MQDISCSDVVAENQYLSLIGGEETTKEEVNMSEKPHLLLKWGGIKGWSNMTDAQLAILQRWNDEGVSMSAAMQVNTDKHKAIICELIDTMEDGQIFNDWSGDSYTKEEAKKYVMEFKQ